MKTILKNNVQISDIINTVTDPDNGKGILGFVLTFSNGRMQNQVLDYGRDDYEFVMKEITKLYQQMKNRYGLY